MTSATQSELGATRTGPNPRVALLVILVGIGELAAGLLAPLAVHAPRLPKWLDVGSTLAILTGAALAAGGLLALLFTVATARSFEWFIAWRYLRDRSGPRSWATLVVGVAFAVCALGLFLLATFWGRMRADELALGPNTTQRILQGAALGVGVLAYVVIFFGVLLLSFSLFTSISIFGVFLGTAALVVVLSVMGGFEHDLRKKILGTNAHAVVTRPRQAFTDYRGVMKEVAATRGLVAQTPYLESEVMITSQTNLSGVLVKGIDPETIGRVTDLPKYIRAEGGAGQLSDLLHPERLARIPEARFKPLVSDPLGEPPPDDAGDDASSRPSTQAASQPGLPSPGKHKKAMKPRLEDLVREAQKQVGKKVPARPVYPGIVIGAELAKNLRLYVGDDVNLVAPLGGMSPMGPIPKAKPFRVAAIFYSGMYEYDTKYVYVTIPAAQKFLGTEDEVTGIEIKAAGLEEASALADELRGRLAARGFQVQDWKQINVSLFSALKLEKFVMFVVLTFIVIVAAFSIVTNLIMVVLSKTREIAALKTMGASNLAALKVFFYSGIYIGVIGMMVGILTGVALCEFLAHVGLPLDPEVYYISELPVRMNALDISIVGLASVGLSFLATVYPSLIAARLQPVQGLRRYEE
jgi:lipoprotein-releasing system permease protein